MLLAAAAAAVAVGHHIPCCWPSHSMLLAITFHAVGHHIPCCWPSHSMEAAHGLLVVELCTLFAWHLQDLLFHGSKCAACVHLCSTAVPVWC
jgi:hypothetical protein